MERVGIYNRCSTEEESQKNALASQAAESCEIAEKKGWQITARYIEAQTGTVAEKRTEYQRLLADMERNLFDIVMIKSIDRLMRSAKDWYFFLNRLNENGLRLYIYIEGKFYTSEDNLISGIKAILAEDFSRELSKKIKNAHRRRQEKKSGVNITCEMFGWDKLGHNSYAVNEREADYYRMAFALAREGKGFYSISNLLYEMGARSRSGQKISGVQWRKMLYTPRAHGAMLLNTRTYNFDTKRYEAVPREQWIYMENALPPIVNRDYQEEVLAVLKKRAAGETPHARTLPRNRGKYVLSGKLICGECGKPYYHTGEGRDGAVWKCSTCLKNGRPEPGRERAGCNGKVVREEKVLKEAETLFRTKYPEKWRQEGKLLDQFIKVVEEVLKGQEGKEKKEVLQKEHLRIMTQKEVLLEKLVSGVVGDEEYYRFRKKLDEKAAQVENQLREEQSRQESKDRIQDRLWRIRETAEREGVVGRAQTLWLIRESGGILIRESGWKLLERSEKSGQKKEAAFNNSSLFGE